MKIHESQPNLDIDLPNITADSTFTVWNKDTKKYEKANHIKDTGLPSTSHILIYYGLTGQGKTSLLCSLVTSKKKGSKVYRGVFDKIYICASYSSMRSIAGDPFKSIPEDQYYETFNERFLRDVTRRVHDEVLRLIVLSGKCQAILATLKKKLVVDDDMNLGHEAVDTILEFEKDYESLSLESRQALLD